MSFSELFLAHRPDAPGTMSHQLEARLGELVERGQCAWPQLEIEPEAFVRYVAERLPARADPAEALPNLHAADLYLACGCTLGLSEAVAAFEAHYISQVSAYLARRDALPAFTDEVKQMLRERLLVADRGLLPRIASYNGRGPLGGWLRMTAARVAVDLRRKQSPRDMSEDGLPLRAADTDPELTYLKTRYSFEFRQAFEATLSSLSAREGNVLRLYFLEGMPARAIGAMYGVSSRTVQRWIAETRSNILRETRRLLGQQLELSASQLDSLMGIVQSELNLSIHRFLQKNKE